MFTDEIRRFIEVNSPAIVASADESGNPHMALGSGMTVLDGTHLMLENWYCRTTLRNVTGNPRVAIAVLAQESGTGYQFVGTVAHGHDVAYLDAYVPGSETADSLQALTRIVVRVEDIFAFCSGIHTDLPLVS